MSGIHPIGYGGMPVTWQQFYYAARIAAVRSAAVNPAQPNHPVEPVSPVRRVAPDTAVRIPIAVREPRVPTEGDLDSAVETLAHMRIRFSTETAVAALEV